MSSELRRLREIFLRVCDLEPSERAEVLEHACAGDGRLRANIELLLENDSDSRAWSAGLGELPERVLQQLHLADLSVEAPSVDRPLPQRIGSYRILDKLGEGGMGVVYRAEQQSPLREVAIKVIRPELATPRILRRFEHEARALARLQHPGIAQIHEVGTSETSAGRRPFLAMELVKGTPLLEHAQRRDLGIRERLRLFVDLCRAVEHAHRRGVIHRDLKPANVLCDEEGRPKVLDFGVAKLLDDEEQETTGLTRAGQFVGTLAYSSPEQCRGDAAAIDTRSDVYALGMIAYELLCRRSPYASEGRNIFEQMRIICEETPLRPSTVDRRLRGDAETIVLKALAKEPERRYGSVSELAADIERFLRQEPIVARPASFIYALRKFTARNRLLVSSLTLALLGVLSLAVGVVHGAAADRRTVGALSTLRQALVVANDSNPYLLSESSREAALKELAASLGDALGNIEVRYGVGGGEMALVLDTVGLVLLGFGERDRAVEFLTKVLELERSNRGPDHVQTMSSMHNLAMALALAGRNAEAEDLYRETIEKRIRVLSPADPETASTQYNLGLLLARTERWAEAEELFRSAWVARTASLGEQDRATLRAGSELARTLASLGRLNDSVELDQKILQSRVAVLGEDDRETLSSRNNLAEGLREIGRLKEAKEQTARTLGILRDSEPDVALAMTALWSHANAVHRSGELLSAESEYREALALHRWTLGELDLKTLGVRTNLGALLADKGQAAEAEPFLLELIGDYEKLGRDESADVLRVKHDLAKVYHDAGRYREAQDLFEEVFERRRTLLGEENMETLSTLVGLGSALAELGELEEAQTLFNEAVTSTTYRRNWRIPDVLVARFNVAEVELRRDRPEAAAEILPELLKDAVQTWSNAHEYVGVFRAVYGRCLLRTERTAEAEEQLLEARRVIARDGAAGKYWHEAGQDLIELYASAGEAKADSIRGVLEASAPR